MNYPALVAELRDDPLGRGYSALSHEEVAASLNTANRTALAPNSLVTTRTVFGVFADPTEAEAFLQALEAAAEHNPVVARALKWLEPAQGGIDLGHPTVRAVLDQLAAAEVVSQEAVATVKALGEKQVSRGEELGLGTPVGAGHVESARDMMEEV